MHINTIAHHHFRTVTAWKGTCANGLVGALSHALVVGFLYALMITKEMIRVERLYFMLNPSMRWYQYFRAKCFTKGKIKYKYNVGTILLDYYPCLQMASSFRLSWTRLRIRFGLLLASREEVDFTENTIDLELENWVLKTLSPVNRF